MNTFDRTSPEHAHIRLDGHERTHKEIKQVLVELQESDKETKEWQKNKDDAIMTIRNWFIGATVFYVFDKFGIVDAVKALAGFL